MTLFLLTMFAVVELGPGTTLETFLCKKVNGVPERWRNNSASTPAQAANDKVLHLMGRMELPNRYRRSQELLHTSSDGQKFEVKVESLNANHSFKYFGKGKGVSVYSFI